MSAGTLDDRYLEWLVSRVAVVKTRKSSKTYWGLFRQLYSTPFVWSVPNDENRSIDGLMLRREWPVEADEEWFNLDCSFLEMLIALCERGSFQSDEPVAWWFWHILENLGFIEYNDRDGVAEDLCAMRLRVVNERLYESDGLGGMFPIRDTDQDQRRVEIWYQLCEYILQD